MFRIRKLGLVSPCNLVANYHNPNKHCLSNCFCQNLLHLVKINTYFEFYLIEFDVLLCRPSMQKVSRSSPVCCLTSYIRKFV
jgi:hypothetical protein